MRDYGRNFRHVVVFFLIGPFARIGFGRLGRLAAFRGLIRSCRDRWRWFLLAFIFLGRGLLRALGRRVLVLLHHCRRNRQHGKKENDQNSHACLRGKNSWSSIIAFSPMALGKVSPKGYNSAGPGTITSQSPGVRV